MTPSAKEPGRVPDPSRLLSPGGNGSLGAKCPRSTSQEASAQEDGSSSRLQDGVAWGWDGVGWGWGVSEQREAYREADATV